MSLSNGAEQNFYEMLGIPMSATNTEITVAYRAAMRRTHPDRVPAHRRASAEVLAKQVNAAYATLADPEKRRRYDAQLRVDETQRQLMDRYVGGLGGPGMPRVTSSSAQPPRRQMTSAERRDRRRSERSAIVSVLSVFLVVSLGAIGLVILFALVSWILGQIV